VSSIVAAWMALIAVAVAGGRPGGRAPWSKHCRTRQEYMFRNTDRVARQRGDRLRMARWLAHGVGLRHRTLTRMAQPCCTPRVLINKCIARHGIFANLSYWVRQIEVPNLQDVCLRFKNTKVINNELADCYNDNIGDAETKQLSHRLHEIQEQTELLYFRNRTTREMQSPSVDATVIRLPIVRTL
jgi:hypothetical protein